MYQYPRFVSNLVDSCSPGSRMLTNVMACRIYRHTRLGPTQASQIVPSSTHAPAPRGNGDGNDSLPPYFLCPLPVPIRREDGADFGGEGMEGRKGGALGDSSRTSMAEECPLSKGAHDAVSTAAHQTRPSMAAILKIPFCHGSPSPAARPH
ncbi:hypothetical protein DFH09DRAFT_1315866 [Mycena vulgaris]|nr:hypothetical protein DFH09DRAFT_1315866 [Mycena vulgaris]